MFNSILSGQGYIEKNASKYLYVFMHIPKCAGGTTSNHMQWKYKGAATLDPDSKDRKAIFNSLNGHESKLAQEEWKDNPYLIKRSWIYNYILSLSNSQREYIRCIHGHAVPYGIHEHFNRESRYLTFLREPTLRFISLYNYMATVRVTPERLRLYEIQKDNGEIRTLEEWLEEANLAHNSMTSFLAQMFNAEDLGQLYYSPTQTDFESVKRMLADFYFVGLTECDDDIQFVYNRLGIFKYLADLHALSKTGSYVRPRNYQDAKKIVSKKCPFDEELYEYGVQINLEIKKRLKDYDRAVLYTRFRRNASRKWSGVFKEIRNIPDSVKSEAK